MDRSGSGCSGPPGALGREGGCSWGSGQGRPRQAPLSPEAASSGSLAAACSQLGSQGLRAAGQTHGVGAARKRHHPLAETAAECSERPSPLCSLLNVPLSLFPEPASQRPAETWPIKSEQPVLLACSGAETCTARQRPMAHQTALGGPTSRTREVLPSQKKKSQEDKKYLLYLCSEQTLF